MVVCDAGTVSSLGPSTRRLFLHPSSGNTAVGLGGRIPLHSLSLSMLINTASSQCWFERRRRYGAVGQNLHCEPRLLSPYLCWPKFHLLNLGPTFLSLFSSDGSNPQAIVLCMPNDDRLSIRGEMSAQLLRQLFLSRIWC